MRSGKAVPARHYELCGVQRERAGHIANALGDLGERIGFTGQDGSPQVFGLVAELLETRLIGKAGHGAPFAMPAVRVVRPKGGKAAICSLRCQAGSALPADRRPPAGLGSA
jgi:hypothetical protein